MSLFNVMYVLCRERAVTNVGKTCGPTPCLMLAINTFKKTGYFSVNTDTNFLCFSADFYVTHVFD